MAVNREPRREATVVGPVAGATSARTFEGGNTSSLSLSLRSSLSDSHSSRGAIAAAVAGEAGKENAESMAGESSLPETGAATASAGEEVVGSEAAARAA